MSRLDGKISNNQLSENIISYLNENLTKTGKSILIVLYTHQTLQHKDLAAMLDIQPSSLSNIIKKIDKVYKDLIKFVFVGRDKFYSLSQIAETYTEVELLPKETAKKYDRTSFLYNDPLVQDVLESLKEFQKFEGDDWDIVLDDLLFVEIRNISAANNDSKEENYQNFYNFKEQSYQNYTNFKNALITLITQHGKQAVQKVYSILDEKILTKRIDFLLSNLLDDFNQMEPLFQLEKKDLQFAYDIIDRIFFESYPDIFGKNSVVYPKPLQREYYSVRYAINIMINEFKENNYDKAVSIGKWERKFHTKEHFSCLSYIAAKCSTVYLR